MHIIQIYGRVCRVCMCKRNNLHNLNDIAEEYSLSIEEMLQKILHQKTKQFPVPREICMECMDHLYIAYRFQEMCWNTNDQLYKIWEKSHKATDEGSVEVDEEMKHCVERCDDDDLDPIKLESVMEEAADAKSSTSKLTLESNKKSNNESGEQRLEIEGNGAIDKTFGNRDDTGTTKRWRCSRGKPIQHAHRRGKHNTTIQLHMCKICFYPNKTKDLLQQHMSDCHKHIKEDEKANKTHDNDNDDDDDDYEDDENVPLSSLRKNGNSLTEVINLCSGVITEEGEGSNEEDKQSPGDISIQPTNSTNYCPTCNKQFKYTHHLAKHQCKTKTISTHSHNCEICSKEFSSANMLQKHKRSKHQEIKTSRKANIKDIVQQSEDMQQKLCSSLTKGKQGITEGNEMNDIRDSDYTLAENDEDGDEENADDADYVDTEQESLKTKTPSATSNDYRCTECNASFRFEKQLERHIKKHTEAHKFVCVVCNDRFKYPFMLQKHTERHHPEESTKRNVTENKKDNLEKSHTCNYCPSAYTNVGGLAQHMSKKHPEIVPFKCDKCDKTFVVEEHLKIHTNRHMGIKNFKCELCDKSFSFKFAMKQHMRIHTGDLNYLCTLCGKKFYRPSNLRQHMQRHGDEKPYSCPHCPKRFKCPSDRYIHLMSHQEGKNHVCSTCGARFSRVDTLHQHQVLHTGEKPYKCDQCPMAFPRLMNLNRHLRTHTGEKPYKCKYCDKAYAQSNDLNKHLRTHIGENTYICTQCPAAFKYQADLRNHEWDHYRKQKEEEQRCQGDVTMNEKEIKAPETIMECNK